jgi:hypothetical protein
LRADMLQYIRISFRAQTSLCWRPCPEVEVSKLEQWPCVQIDFPGQKLHGSALHWVIVSHRIKQSQDGCRHSNVEECQLLACIAVDVSCRFARSCQWP